MSTQLNPWSDTPSTTKSECDPALPPAEKREEKRHLITWETPHGRLAFGGPCRVMGILNVTPDSFSDGGLYSTTEAAVVRGREMVSEGADVLDVGGESTRPGARPVAAIEQIQRVVPVIRRMRSEGVTLPISIDTRSAAVAAAALDAGADIVNDISAARHDSDMPRLLAERRVPFVAMHMQGTPETMQLDPRYGDVVAEVRAFFIERAETLAAFGVDVSRMMVDPGIGFGKKLEHNLALLRAIGVFRDPWPVLIGPSRKRFIGELIGQTAADRLIGTAAVVAHCALAGVDLVRVHDVEAMKSIIHVCSRLAEAE